MNDGNRALRKLGKLRRLRLLADVRRLQQSGKPKNIPTHGNIGSRQSDKSRRDAAFRRTIEWLIRRWAPQSEAKAAILIQIAKTDKSWEDVKREALRYGLWVALGAAEEKKKDERLGDDRLRRLGDRIIVYQKRDLQALEWLFAGKVEKLPGEAAVRLTRPAVGGRTRLLGEERDPIKAAFLGDYSDAVRPADLDPEHFLHWLRRRSIAEARDWLLDSTEKLRESVLRDLERAEKVEKEAPHLRESDRMAGRRAQTVVQEFEHLRQANRASLERLSPEVAATIKVGLAELLERCTDSEEEKLRLLLDRLQRDKRRGMTEAKRIVAKELGISLGALNTAFHRMRDRYENPL